jgi:hypothetical protein
LILGKKIMIFKLELSPQNFHYDVLYPLYSVGSNEMPFTAWKQTERNRQRDRKKYVMILGGFVIPAVQNNSLNDST